jgi:hypothetical protein
MHYKTVSGLEQQDFLTGFVRDITERIDLAQATVRSGENAQRARSLANVIKI